MRADSGEHLKELLREDHRYVFTLIQKFRRRRREVSLSTGDDIIVMTDEAHRSQYDTLALNMRDALPKAAFIGFTGTPLIAGEERTKDVFGDYVSSTISSSRWRTARPCRCFTKTARRSCNCTTTLNEDIYQVIEDAELDEEQEQKLERELGQQYHLLTRDERLEKIAEDIVRHFTGRGFKGKAMVVCIDKADGGEDVRQGEDAVGQARGRTSKKSLRHLHRRNRTPCSTRLNWMKTTDMAVIVSQAQNEVRRLQKQGPRHRAAPASGWLKRPWRRSSRTRKTRFGWCSCAPCG